MRIIFIFFISIASVLASDKAGVIDNDHELSSESQKKRDAVAARIRKTYVLPKKEKWLPLLPKLKNLKFREVEKIVEPHCVHEIGFYKPMGRPFSISYRLDSLHVLKVTFRGKDNTAERAELLERLAYYLALAPDNFTGESVSYFANGEVKYRIQYKNGLRYGKSISYYPDGKKSSIIRYVNNKRQGECTVYYPTGEILYRGSFQDGKETGEYFKKDGTPGPERGPFLGKTVMDLKFKN